MGKNNNAFIIFFILLVVALLAGSKLGLFSITGNEKIVRSFPSTVNNGENITVTYTVSGASGTWGASVEDLISCKNSTGSLFLLWDGMSTKFVMLSTEGTTTTKTFKTPNAYDLTCTFTGDYQFGNRTIQSFSSQYFTTEVAPVVCASGADTSSDGVVSRDELGVYLIKWISGTVTRASLGQAIEEWASSKC